MPGYNHLPLLQMLDQVSYPRTEFNDLIHTIPTNAQILNRCDIDIACSTYPCVHSNKCCIKHPHYHPGPRVTGWYLRNWLVFVNTGSLWWGICPDWYWWLHSWVFFRILIWGCQACHTFKAKKQAFLETFQSINEFVLDTPTWNYLCYLLGIYWVKWHHHWWCETQV